MKDEYLRSLKYKCQNNKLTTSARRLRIVNAKSYLRPIYPSSSILESSNGKAHRSEELILSTAAVPPILMEYPKITPQARTPEWNAINESRLSDPAAKYHHKYS